MNARYLIAFVSLLSARATSQTPVTLTINADQGRDTINRHIYGQFAEHLGRGIYDGVWTREGSAAWHLRTDVVHALRTIKVPNVRWPGGCFADYYHWKDGIGPRAARPALVNNNWGGVTEDNGVGTHEFLEFTKAIGAEPFVVGNVGSGTVQEMSEWWEYLNQPGGSPMSALRRANGQQDPWNVRFFGVGNESWGCGGNMRPEYYADQVRRYGSFLPSYGKVRPFRIVTGPSDADYNWMEVMMRDAGRYFEGIDLHHYMLSGTWAKKGSATEFTETEWSDLMSKAMGFDELITRQAAIMDRYDPRKRVWLVVGEWGTWYDVDPGTNPGFLQQQNTLRDALVASVSLDAFNKHADRVRMANIAQMVNVLQAMILTKGDELVLTPTYHVFEMYKVHQDATSLPVALSTPDYSVGAENIPAVSAAASRDTTGKVHLSLVNANPNAAITVSCMLAGLDTKSVSGRVLTSPAMQDCNTFAAPAVVKPQPFTGATLAAGKVSVVLPAKSVVVLSFD